MQVYNKKYFIIKKFLQHFFRFYLNVKLLIKLCYINDLKSTIFKLHNERAVMNERIAILNENKWFGCSSYLGYKVNKHSKFEIDDYKVKIYTEKQKLYWDIYLSSKK